MAIAYTPWLYLDSARNFESKEEFYPESGEKLWVCRAGLEANWEIPKNTQRVRFFVTTNSRDWEHTMQIRRMRLYSSVDATQPSPYAYLRYDDERGNWSVHECWDFVQTIANQAQFNRPFNSSILSLGVEYDLSRGNGK